MCVVENCENDAKAKGFCNKHYARVLRTGSPESIQKRRDIIVPEGKSLCILCEEVLPVSEFFIHETGRIHSYCKPCSREYDKVRAGIPERKQNLAKSGRKHRLKQIGWSEERHQMLFYAQGGLCFICGAGGFENGAAKGLTADHDHETGQPRMLLCDFCNVGLGRFLDSPEILDAASAYLRAFRRTDG